MLQRYLESPDLLHERLNAANTSSCKPDNIMEQIQRLSELFGDDFYHFSTQDELTVDDFLRDLEAMEEEEEAKKKMEVKETGKPVEKERGK
jgi:hypothetical protein